MDCIKSKTFSKPLLNSTLFTSPGIYRRFSYDLESGSAKKEEFYIQPFLDLLNQRNSSFTCFDLDYTLIKPKSGKKFPIDYNDWTFQFSDFL